MTSIGYRKVIAAIIIMSLGVGALCLKGDIPPGFLQLLETTFGFFVAGNMFEHYMKAPDVPPAGLDVTPHLEALRVQNEDIKAGLGQVANATGAVLDIARGIQNT